MQPIDRSQLRPLSSVGVFGSGQERR
jgi:hypothetical protein